VRKSFLKVVYDFYQFINFLFGNILKFEGGNNIKADILTCRAFVTQAVKNTVYFAELTVLYIRPQSAEVLFYVVNIEIDFIHTLKNVLGRFLRVPYDTVKNALKTGQIFIRIFNRRAYSLKLIYCFAEIFCNVKEFTLRIDINTYDIIVSVTDVSCNIKKLINVLEIVHNHRPRSLSIFSLSVSGVKGFTT